jgi:hypothetical protein
MCSDFLTCACERRQESDGLLKPKEYGPLGILKCKEGVCSARPPDQRHVDHQESDYDLKFR